MPQSERHLKILLSSVPIAVAMFDRQMHYLMVNQRWIEFCGVDKQEIGACFYDILPVARERWGQTHQRAMAGAVEQCDEEAYVRPDGSVVWGRWEVRPWHVTTGEIGGVIIFIEDITIQKLAESKLRASREQEQARRMELEALMEAAPAIVWIAHDAECRNITGNRAAQEFLRVSPGRNVSKTAPENKPEHFVVYRQGHQVADRDLPMQVAARTGTPMLRQELEIRFNDQSSLWLYGNAVPLFDTDGTVRGAVGTFVDVTQKIQAEAALRASEVRERLRREEVEAFLHAIPAPVWIAQDPFCQEMTGNAAARALLKATENQNLSRSAPDTERPLFEVRRHGAPISPDQLPMQRAASQGQAVTGDEIEIIRPDGAVLSLYGNAVPLFGTRGEVRGCIGVMMDISQIKKAEEERRAFSGRLQHAREEERTRLAREIHDVLAQELTRLKLEFAWMKRRLAKPLDQLVQQSLQTKLKEVNELTDDAILAVQKIATELRPVVLDTHGLSEAMNWQIRDFSKRTGIPCEAHLPPANGHLDRDCSTALFRILQESLTNVARHSQATRVEIRLLIEPASLTLIVSDNGRGFEIGLLKDPSSLGLIGMRERASLLAGECTIEGVLGVGTTIRACIPLPATQPSAPRAA